MGKVNLAERLLGVYETASRKAITADPELTAWKAIWRTLHRTLQESEIRWEIKKEIEL